MKDEDIKIRISPEEEQYEHEVDRTIEKLFLEPYLLNSKNPPPPDLANIALKTAKRHRAIIEAPRIRKEYAWCEDLYDRHLNFDEEPHDVQILRTEEGIRRNWDLIYVAISDVNGDRIQKEALEIGRYHDSALAERVIIQFYYVGNRLHPTYFHATESIDMFINRFLNHPDQSVISDSTPLNCMYSLAQNLYKELTLLGKPIDPEDLLSEESGLFTQAVPIAKFIDETESIVNFAIESFKRKRKIHQPNTTSFLILPCMIGTNTVH